MLVLCEGVNACVVGLLSTGSRRGECLWGPLGASGCPWVSLGSLTASPLTETFHGVPVSLHLGRFPDREEDRARPVQRGLQSNLSAGQETCGTEEGAGEHPSAESAPRVAEAGNSALLTPVGPCVQVRINGSSAGSDLFQISPLTLWRGFTKLIGAV